MIAEIRLSNFRNFNDRAFSFSKNTTVIIGLNASGKTNILEALYLLSTGKSFRARIEEEMINYDKELARVRGELYAEKLEVMLTRGEIRVGTKTPERVARKRLLVNGVGKRLLDFAGIFKSTLFGPWDLELVTESPSTRRRFLDAVLAQVDREYGRSLLSYEKGLRQRNKLLLQIRDEGIPRSHLIFWDQLLIKSGDYISLARQDFIDFINKTDSLNDQDFKLDYDKSAISEGRLQEYAREEVAAATTLVGPHRDDFCFKLMSHDLARYGSRGEQRMSVLWLKLAELSFVEEKSGEKPTLLLDDIFSELDHEHRDVVMSVVGAQQTIITTTDPHFVEGMKGVEKIELID